MLTLGKLAVTVIVAIPCLFGAAAAWAAGLGMFENCFNPPSYMRDQWGWRLSGVPLGFVAIVFGSALALVIIAATITRLFFWEDKEQAKCPN